MLCKICGKNTNNKHRGNEEVLCPVCRHWYDFVWVRFLHGSPEDNWKNYHHKLFFLRGF